MKKVFSFLLLVFSCIIICDLNTGWYNFIDDVVLRRQ